MSIEKQKLYNEIGTLPEELANQVIKFIDTGVANDITIKSKKDLKEKLQKGLDDIKVNKVYSLDEMFAKLDNM